MTEDTMTPNYFEADMLKDLRESARAYQMLDLA